VLGDRITGGASAYTKVGYEICTRSAELGYDMAHIPQWKANRMGKYAFGKVLIYPSGDDPFCEDVAVPHYTDFKADMLITVKEPWVFNNIFKWAINFVPICPIDHSPVSDGITARLPSAFKVIAISRFGQAQLKRNNIDSVYIRHGVRTDIYKPMDKQECKKRWYLDKFDFVVGIVAMNRVRKGIPRMLRGVKRFVELNPDVKIGCMLWTNIQPKRPREDITVGVSDTGVNLLPEIMRLGLNNVVQWPQWGDVQKIGGIPDYDPQGGWDMVSLYNAMDVNFLCSGGEGAGLPYIESAACGVISVGTKYAGAPEYIGPGITVPWYDYDVNNTPGVRYVLPDIDKMAEALTKVLNGNPEKMAKKVLLHAKRHDWGTVMSDYWVPFLEECETELYPKVTKDGVSSWRKK
jgi:glycosyltransferase involved in cell wall biosynthesis